ncbi:MAG: hypothetical protein HPY59_00655 [Anaerolineae bacterium]|nr:hypothetical protein [Anaerolineae bacterium]
MLELIQPILQYHDTLHRQLWESIMGLSDAQFVQEIPYSHGSIRNQMVHLTAVEGRWLRGLKGLPDARSYNPDPAGYPTRQSAYHLWQAGAQEWAAYAGALDEASLLYISPGMPGPAWQVLLHVVNHGTDHRAQVLRALHDFGAPTFDQDLIFHLWARR